MSNVVAITKDLGTVLCGQQVSESFDLKNAKDVPTRMTVKEETDAGGFAIRPRTANVCPGKSVRFNVTFVSHIPDVVYEKKYAICDEWGAVGEFCIRCTSAGPEVTPKNYRVKFFVFKNVKLNNKRLEIENRSPCPTRFQFERMGNNRPFEVCQESGLLRGHGKFVLDVKFSPSQFGVYYRKIHCLLQYHEPLVFTLVGICNPRLKVSHSQLSIHSPVEAAPANNYEAYMRNLSEDYVPERVDSCIEFLSPRKLVRFEDKDDENEMDGYEQSPGEGNGSKEEPLTCDYRRNKNQVVLTDYFVNMDRESSFSKAIKMINTSHSKEYFFEWSNENGKYFSVAPKSGHLKQGEEVELELDFAPDLQDRLYHGELDVRIFPLISEAGETAPDVITLPVTLSLSAVGHSFGADSAGWLEQCEIEPDELMLPPCAPGHVVYSTLLIKKHGQLPLTFEFFPPGKSYIKIKPPLGCINSSHQLVIVQFNAPAKSDGKYIETWRVGYNHKTTYFGQIRFSANVENPTVIVGKDNSLIFDTVLPGGISKAMVPVRNPTNLKLRYELSIPEDVDWTEIPVLSGELEPLSIIYTDAIFKPLGTGEYSDYISCSTKTVKTPEYEASTKIELRGSCQEGFLVATPDRHDFGLCLYGAEQSTKFHVFNFTPILMHFELCAVNEGAFGEAADNVIKLVPEKGSVSGKSHIEVEVKITPKVLEPSKHFIRCKLLSSGTESTEPPTVVDVRTLFTLEIEGTLPTFQTIDLDVEGGGPLISPDWLWKMMDINNLNKILREIRPGEEKWVDARLPEALAGSTPLIIHLLVEGKGLHSMSLDIKSKNRSHFSNQPSWTTALDAEEFNFMAFTPSKLYLEPGTREILKLAVTFEAVGASLYEWSLRLSQNRVINIRSTINAFSKEDHSHTSMYLSPDIRLKPVCIGDLRPPVQLFWLYNNTPSPTAYIVDKLSLNEATPPFNKIFNCLNPNGVLRPFSCLPLLFVFRPKELKMYRASTSLCLKSDHAADLHLSGCGTLNYSQFIEHCHEDTVPEKPILKQSHVAVEQSSKVFTLPPFPTFSDERRIFHLTNTSKGNVWAFRWHSFKVDDVIAAAVEPVEGKIEPGEKLLLTLTVKSYKHPTNIHFSVPCDVIDYTSLEVYENAVKLKENVNERFKDYFTITEKGSFNEVWKAKSSNPSAYFMQCHWQGMATTFTLIKELMNVEQFSNVNVEVLHPYLMADSMHWSKALFFSENGILDPKNNPVPTRCCPAQSNPATDCWSEGVGAVDQLTWIPEIVLPMKPKSCHIFIAVRANIVDQSSLENKLRRRDLQKLRSGREAINLPCLGGAANEGVTHLVNETLEKILWRILNSSKFEEQLRIYRERYGRITYHQITPVSRKKTEDLEKRLRTYIPKSLTEHVMETTIVDILRKKFA